MAGLQQQVHSSQQEEIKKMSILNIQKELKYIQGNNNEVYLHCTKKEVAF